MHTFTCATTTDSIFHSSYAALLVLFQRDTPDDVLVVGIGEAPVISAAGPYAHALLPQQKTADPALG